MQVYHIAMHGQREPRGILHSPHEHRPHCIIALKILLLYGICLSVRLCCVPYVSYLCRDALNSWQNTGPRDSYSAGDLTARHGRYFFNIRNYTASSTKLQDSPTARIRPTFTPHVTRQCRIFIMRRREPVQLDPTNMTTEKHEIIRHDRR